MNHLQRVSYILGSLLVGLAAWMIVSDRRVRGLRTSPPVEKLAEDLKQAWAGHHTP